MKKKILFIMLSVLIIAGLTACSVESESTDGTAESTVFSTTKTESAAEKEITESETTTQKSESSETSSATTTRPDERKSAGQTTTKKVTATQNQTTTKKQTVSQSQTTTRKVTTTQKQNVTQKQTTTKKETTTVTTTVKTNKLSKSDVDWVQSQAHSYIKSKGCNVDSSVGSFSGRISTKNFTDRNSLLAEVKEWIDSEYNDCINSGWNAVDMYCKTESRSDGSFFIYVMYG